MYTGQFLQASDTLPGELTNPQLWYVSENTAQQLQQLNDQ